MSSAPWSANARVSARACEGLGELEAAIALILIGWETDAGEEEVSLFRARHWEGYRQVMSTGQTRYGANVLRVPAAHKDGRPLSIAFTVALVSSQKGSIEAIVAIVRDETARWQGERALRQRIAELEAGPK